MTQREKDILEKRKIAIGREDEIKKFALALLEQCESKELTVKELYKMLDFMQTYCENHVVIRGLQDT